RARGRDDRVDRRAALALGRVVPAARADGERAARHHHGCGGAGGPAGQGRDARGRGGTAGAAGRRAGSARGIARRWRAAGRAARAAFVTLAFIWSAAAGVLGAVLAFLWAGTDHWVTYGNENLLQTSPLSLALLVLLPLAMSGGTRATTALRRTAAGLALLSLA